MYRKFICLLLCYWCYDCVSLQFIWKFTLLWHNFTYSGGAEDQVILANMVKHILYA